MLLKFLVVILLAICSFAIANPIKRCNDMSLNTIIEINVKERLKQLGLHPRIFRYGTRSAPLRVKKPQPRTQPNRKRLKPKPRRNWVDAYVKNLKPWRKSLGPEEKLGHRKWDAVGRLELEMRRRPGLSERRLKRMENEVAEILWKY
ncbi:uncharacterized protein LOC129760266 [Uranotaenia lowii]|uniref:uncharacterized protein LOC129760266 n=1 Tax=Uranotaenia lowii TaxID=190385 RepID=UPI002479B52B|nr:uncharacterized protein LOC129760266 [Uranotaenia lowii]